MTTPSGLPGPVHPWRVAIEYAFWGEGWADTRWYGRVWYYFWQWVFSTAWERGLRPHLVPRRYAKECYEFWVPLRIPEQLHRYVWGNDADGYCGEFRDDNGPWRLAVFCGDTREEAERNGMDLLRWAKDEAGMIGTSYGVIYHDHEPEPYTWTR